MPRGLKRRNNISYKNFLLGTNYTVYTDYTEPVNEFML